MKKPLEFCQTILVPGFDPKFQTSSASPNNKFEQ